MQGSSRGRIDSTVEEDRQLGEGSGDGEHRLGVTDAVGMQGEWVLLKQWGDLVAGAFEDLYLLNFQRVCDEWYDSPVFQRRFPELMDLSSRMQDEFVRLQFCMDYISSNLRPVTSLTNEHLGQLLKVYWSAMIEEEKDPNLGKEYVS
ncbi:hypothetical protein V5O48_005300 [Marasmius crinis-equi]|uniref:Uncharacterized protein n=1 Tax=Marasmius crinis-equi TaxID=585013 RepID=A0ABR3FMM4_9AGAR